MKHNQWNLSGILIIQDWIRPTSLSLISKEIRLWAFFRIPYSTINYGSFTNEAGRLSSLEFFISCSCVKRRGKSLVNAALNPGKREEKKDGGAPFARTHCEVGAFLGRHFRSDDAVSFCYRIVLREARRNFSCSALVEELRRRRRRRKKKQRKETAMKSSCWLAIGFEKRRKWSAPIRFGAISETQFPTRVITFPEFSWN